MNKTLVTVTELAETLSLGRTKAYQLLAPKGPLPVVKIGKCVRVPTAAINAWVEQQLKAPQNPG